MAVFLPLPGTFDYDLHPSLDAVVGTRVWAPFGSRAVEGVVVALDPPDAQAERKTVSRRVDAPPLPPRDVALAQWIAEYYLAPPGEALRLFVPAGAHAEGVRRARLTDAGRALAGALEGALLPPALAELPREARALLGRLARARRPLRIGEEDGRALAALVAAGLAEGSDEVRTRGAPDELWLRAVPAPPGAFARAPRQAEVHARVSEAGELRLGDLTREVSGARAAVQALLAAGHLVGERRGRPDDAFLGARVDDAPPPTLTAAQAAALDRVLAAVEAGQPEAFLLHGVTGSGKTEVYLRAIARVLERGRTALVLVPEIALTPQLAARFRGRFGERVAVLHSGLSETARRAAVERVRRGEAPIALGARSAVFAPLPRLGIVVVDEEHDPSFKQQEGVRYHGRDVALIRARREGAVALIGSATPSVETYHAAREGRLTLLELPERATQRPLPSVEVIDLRRHQLAEGSLLSAPLEAAIRGTLAAGEQALLFLNRRGFSTYVLCKACGEGVRCRDCAVSLTYHKGDDRLVCHYCGFRTLLPRHCPTCGAGTLERLGVGTEQLEEQVRARFPDARVGRLDRDTARGGGLEAVLEGLRARRLDLVVGTQMITKGHDFPSVTLVGVVLADHGMGLPDFRAAERTFQLVEQVGGRAGRHERPGRVLLQTYQPDHPAIVRARQHDYHGFVESEIEARREPRFPPACRLACLLVDGDDAMEVQAAARAAAEAARAAAAREPEEEEASVLGPCEAPIGRLKGRTRWQLFLRARTPRALRQVARQALAANRPRAVRVVVDVDPVSML